MLKDDLKGRLLAQIVWGELEKIAEQALSSVEENKNLGNTEDTKEETENLEEIDEEKDSVIGTKFIVKKEREKERAKGVPILKDRSAENLRFDPKSQSYVPDYKKRLKQAEEYGYVKGKSEGLQRQMEQQISSKEQEVQRLRELVRSQGGNVPTQTTPETAPESSPTQTTTPQPSGQPEQQSQQNNPSPQM